MWPRNPGAPGQACLTQTNNRRRPPLFLLSSPKYITAAPLASVATMFVPNNAATRPRTHHLVPDARRRPPVRPARRGIPHPHPARRMARMVHPRQTAGSVSLPPGLRIHMVSPPFRSKRHPADPLPRVAAVSKKAIRKDVATTRVSVGPRRTCLVSRLVSPRPAPPRQSGTRRISTHSSTVPHSYVPPGPRANA